MKYTQFTDRDVDSALKRIGVDSIEALFAPIPPALRFSGDLNIPPGVSELELLRDTTHLAARNHDAAELTCFLGGGAYDHFIPTLVDAVSSQSEFLTAYTPYQAEASQGMLQLFYEFQTMVCQLTGMEAANASLYEGASAAAEAALMATAVTRRRRVVVVESIHPDTRRVIETYARARDIEIALVPAVDGLTDEDALQRSLDDATAVVVVQTPNLFGCIERLDQIVPACHRVGALVVAVTDPLSCGLLKPPGAFDVDIVAAEGQPLGVPMQYGGPYLGLLAGREAYLRKMPGRIVGRTKDTDGRRGFCLVLQTREQHIKRERATSNICTNEGLLAIRAAVYLACMGRKGLKEVASQSFDKAHYAGSEIDKLDGYELPFAAPFFKEFVVRTTRGLDAALAACRQHGILGGVPMTRLDDRFNDAYHDCFLVAVTEKRTREEIDALVAALRSA